MQNFFENITHRLYLPKFSHFDANSALESLSKICSQDLIIRVSKCAIPVLSSLDLTSKKRFIFVNKFRLHSISTH